ncbi:helix-turn-helix transcriptional regulator [Roseomonas sp. PWR1]|uniref:Helix-turn-helix transcriptional regulator n=1 Tax=Roseomonas nitratireducens TaxID=2820810 RepID=A0ABS4AUB9_9PROT|nr:helix-turn-helix transcriptional regulator [Neoroseomonas nitratireducens]MBP0464960.1 helix-turn-helix transcriptional regulator [Neoroseomonas nitratireducens]
MMSNTTTTPATERAQAAAAALEFDGQVGAALHRQRRSLGLTASEVARRIGITQRQMSRVELGLEPVSLRTAIALGAALGMAPAWFLGVEAAQVPETLGIALNEAHEAWAQNLMLHIARAAGTAMEH